MVLLLFFIVFNTRSLIITIFLTAVCSAAIRDGSNVTTHLERFLIFFPAPQFFRSFCIAIIIQVMFYTVGSITGYQSVCQTVLSISRRAGREGTMMAGVVDRRPRRGASIGRGSITAYCILYGVQKALDSIANIDRDMGEFLVRSVDAFEANNVLRHCDFRRNKNA